MMQWISKHISYPLWEIKEGADRLAELRRLEQSQFWSGDKLLELQLQRLPQIVAHAAATTQFYGERYGQVGVVDSLDLLRQLPTVSKADVRQHWQQMVSRDYPLVSLTEAKTGGSTGKALVVYFDKVCQEYRNAAAMRSDRWAGRDMGTKTAAIWGNPPKDESLRDRLRNSLLSRLVYLDTMALNEQSVGEFVRMWRTERPKVIFGHSHSIYILATFLRKLQVDDVRPQGIITTSMMLLENERAVIEDVLKCKVTNRYGCEEVGLIAAECPDHDGLHVNSEHIIVELLRPDGAPAGPGEEGEVVVTDLMNRGMPLIRYRVEDVAAWARQPCRCGRGAPTFSRVVGRVADFLIKVDGTLVAGVSLVERTLTKISGLDQMQLVQETREHIVANVVVGSAWGEESLAQLRRELDEVFHPIRLEIRVLSGLPQEKSGKYRFSICKVPRT